MPRSRRRASLESTTVSLTTLTRHLERALDLYADIILNPSFPEKDLHRLKLQRLAQLKARGDDAEQTAAAVFPRLIFGLGHPYGRPTPGRPGRSGRSPETTPWRFTSGSWCRATPRLVVVGDVQPDTITAALEGRLRAWAPGPVPQPPSVAAPASPPRNGVYLIDKPAAAQSVLKVGKIGAARKSPDFFPLRVMNAILGGQFASRINLNLREDKGYSYGRQSDFSFRKAPARSRSAPRCRLPSQKSRWSRS